MRKPAAIILRTAPLSMLVSMLAACSAAQPAAHRYEISGEVIALGGGDAGVDAACATCHGLEGQGDGNLVPRLAGLDPGYLARQLENYAQGRRKSAQMEWIARRLEWPARQKVARYYASLPVPAGAASDPAIEDCSVADLYARGDRERGLSSCASCHGADGAGAGLGNPPLAAQPAPYLEAQLDAWAEGRRYGDPGNAMLRISRLLTATERARLAGYSSALPGASGYPAPPAACP